jgi:hypothetical protein
LGILWNILVCTYFEAGDKKKLKSIHSGGLGNSGSIKFIEKLKTA